jgi:exosortase A-associated hydrolase 1
MMNYEERPIVFCCGSDCLYGVLTLPEHAASRGILILVGGPQYRAGSHRQFTLLARQLAADGIPVFRFDFRGMGDSEGDARTFENVEDDVRCAIDRLFAEIPSLSELVILGLCDAASAALFYAYQDRRVTSLVLLNPWVRTEEGSARVYLKHYYTSRIFERELWRKIWSGNFNYAASIRSLFGAISAVVTERRKIAPSAPRNNCKNGCDSASLPERMFQGLERFQGKVLLILSGNDLTAQEFSDLVKGSRKWEKLLASPRFSRFSLPEANHTFSRREWRDQIARWTKEWLYSW